MMRIKVRAYTLKEAEEIMHFCLKQGYEGVQNDSYRYCKECASYHLKKGTCFICVYNGGFGNIYVIHIGITTDNIKNCQKVSLKKH